MDRTEYFKLLKCCAQYTSKFGKLSSDHRRRQWHPTPVLLPGKSQGQRSMVAAVHGVARSRTWLSDFTFTFHFCALEKEMATHSSVLVWRIPGTGEPGGLPSVGLHRVGHDGSNLAAAAVPQWGIKPTPLERKHVILTIGPPGKSWQVFFIISFSLENIFVKTSQFFR